jgi:hypothetical protein
MNVKIPPQQTIKHSFRLQVLDSYVLKFIQQDKIFGSTNEYCIITWLVQHLTFGEALFNKIQAPMLVHPL